MMFKEHIIGELVFQIHKMKHITIHTNETESEEGIFLVNPTWIYLDEKEVQEKIEKGEKVFKVKVEGV